MIWALIGLVVVDVLLIWAFGRAVRRHRHPGDE